MNMAATKANLPTLKPNPLLSAALEPCALTQEQEWEDLPRTRESFLTKTLKK